MRKWLETALVAGVLVACSGKPDGDSSPVGDTGTTSPDAAPCVLRSTPGVSMQPGSTPDTTAPAILDLDSPYTIELSPNGGGWVRLGLPGPGTYNLHTSFSGVVLGLWDDTGEQPISDARANDTCADEIPAVYAITVTQPEVFYLQLGPLSSVYFWVVLQQESVQR